MQVLDVGHGELALVDQSHAVFGQNDALNVAGLGLPETNVVAICLADLKRLVGRERLPRRREYRREIGLVLFSNKNHLKI